MLSLLKLLIALNIFSYCGRFPTNCSLAERCRPRSGDRSPSVATEDSVVGRRSPPRSVSVDAGSARGGDAGGRGAPSFVVGCVLRRLVRPSPCAARRLQPRSQLRRGAPFPWGLPAPPLEAAVAAPATLASGRDGGREPWASQGDPIWE